MSSNAPEITTRAPSHTALARPERSTRFAPEIGTPRQEHTPVSVDLIPAGAVRPVDHDVALALTEDVTPSG
jgi:hypothetical protein